MSKKQYSRSCFFFLLFVSSTLSVNKLHRITLTENSHLNKILILRALLRQEKNWLFSSAVQWTTGFRQGEVFFSGFWPTRRAMVDTESRIKCRRKACRRRFGFLRDVHLLFVFFVVVSAVLALRWVHKPSWPTTFLALSW